MSKKTEKKEADTSPDILPDVSSGPSVAPEEPKKGPADWESGKHSVEKLSLHTGNRIKLNGHNPHNEVGPGPMHRAADILHGWSWHKHNYVNHLELSKKDYLAAIKAAGSFNRHPAAVAPKFKLPEAKSKE